MDTTHADNLNSSWFKQEYVLECGYLKPKPGQMPIRYNPMALYEPSSISKRVTSSLHHLFANINPSNELEITKFYNQYGPLGLYEDEIIKIVAFPYLPRIYPMPDESPIAGVQRFSDELMPLSDLQGRYHIPESRLPFASQGESFVPYRDEVTSRDTWESIEDFRKELVKFKRVINLRIALADKYTAQIKTLIANKRMSPDITDEELLLTANGLIWWDVNSAMENRVHPSFSFDDITGSFSKNITWQCDSLLTALYTMVFLDITRGVTMRRCEKCNIFFESIRPNTKYCSARCQNSDKVQRSREKKKLIIELLDCITKLMQQKIKKELPK